MKKYTGGEKRVEIEAKNYRQACRELMRKFPLLNQKIFSKFAVAIDDEIIPDPLLEPLREGCEIFFVPKIGAG
ncbi:MAG: MoaD/ThiS family protein [Pseudomonadales bacterium]|nr:MoaD/ThiS family protein [Pseudomonadales bacterium]